MVFCNKENCKYRSRKACKSYKSSTGELLYKCKCPHIIIDEYADGCSDVYTVPDNSCMCLQYRNKFEKEND